MFLGFVSLPSLSCEAVLEEYDFQIDSLSLPCDAVCCVERYIPCLHPRKS